MKQINNWHNFLLFVATGAGLGSFYAELIGIFVE